MPTHTLHFSGPRQLNQLYCGKESNLTLVEKTFDAKLISRDDWIQIEGSQESIDSITTIFDLLKSARSQGIYLNSADFAHIVSGVAQGEIDELRETFEDSLIIKIKQKSIVPKTINQKRYLQFINRYDIVLSIGPAGTGKTYLAVAAALHALLMDNRVDKVILTRPAVETGEALGFLPGDLREKILPFLRPLYDAMHDMLGQEETNHLIEKDIIEIAPLAYMRGRTLSNAFVILDEAQNTTTEQMLMFLTRLGDRSRMVVTGDITQVDIPAHKTSGLKQAVQALTNVKGVKLFSFENKDIVRHPLVQNIIDAYEKFHKDSMLTPR